MFVNFFSFSLSEALALAQRFGFSDIETLADFHLALINRDSTQFAERDQAQQAFLRLIPFFGKLQHFAELKIYR